MPPAPETVLPRDMVFLRPGRCGSTTLARLRPGPRTAAVPSVSREALGTHLETFLCRTAARGTARTRHDATEGAPA